jgi:hypothetical protein
MHIITGLLIARLLGKRGASSLVPLLKSGPVRTAHSMPGRVRFVVPSLVGDEQRGTALREKVESLPGIRAVEVSPVTGSVLISYREEAVQAELLFAAVVRLLGLEAELERPPKPVVVEELRSIMDSLNRVVYDRTGGLLDFKSALLIVLAGVGARQLFAEGAKAMPAGFTLIWWGLHQLLGHGEE